MIFKGIKDFNKNKKLLELLVIKDLLLRKNMPFPFQEELDQEISNTKRFFSESEIKSISSLLTKAIIDTFGEDSFDKIYWDQTEKIAKGFIVESIFLRKKAEFFFAYKGVKSYNFRRCFIFKNENFERVGLEIDINKSTISDIYEVFQKADKKTIIRLINEQGYGIINEDGSDSWAVSFSDRPIVDLGKRNSEHKIKSTDYLFVQELNTQNNSFELRLNSYRYLIAYLQIKNNKSNLFLKKHNRPGKRKKQ